MPVLSQRTRGFTLVEVLVALVVLAVGLLGVAVLIVGSLRGTRLALERTQAANLASDMLERIRANAAAGNAYDTTDGTPDPRPEPACERGDDRCEPAVMASHDLARWLEAVARRLDFPMERVLVNVDRYGNTSSATVPTMLDEAVRDGRIKKGDWVLMDVFGAGLTNGSLMLRW